MKRGCEHCNRPITPDRDFCPACEAMCQPAPLVAGDRVRMRHGSAMLPATVLATTVCGTDWHAYIQVIPCTISVWVPVRLLERVEA